MRRLFSSLAFLCLVSSSSTQAVEPRTYIARSNNVSALLYDRFEWAQTDEVQIDIWPRSYSGPLNLDGWFPMLFVSDPISELVYIGKTGTVVEAGHCRFGLGRSESNLSVSNLYLLSARLYHVSEQATQYVTIARGQLNIHWSPDAEGYDLVGGRAVTSMVFNVTIISSGARTGASGSWTNLTEVPLGFADDTDDTDDTVQWPEISDLVGDGSNQLARGNHGHADLVSNSTLASTAAYFRARMDDLEGQIEGSGSGSGTTTNNIYVNIDNSTHITGMVGFAVAYTNLYLPPTTNAGIVTYYVNTNAGSVSGSSAISGVYPVGVTNYNGTSYVYLVSAGGLIIQPSIGGTNVVQFGGQTSHFYSVPVDINLLIVDSWTAAGGGTLGGAGSHSEIYIPVVGGEELEFICGEAGLLVPATNASGFSTVRGGWPGGGIGVQRMNYGQLNGSGAGYNAIKRGTNYIYIGGGGGGGMTAYNGGAGGGVSGGNGSGSSGSSGSSGAGGTQTDGGIAPTSSVPLAITNTAGGFLVGGDAGASTNLLAGASGGGGAGFRGGSGGLTGNAANSRGTGAGGSSWANTNLVIYFSTTRGVAQTPPKQELPWYGSDTRGIGWGTSVGTNGGNGGMVIREVTM